MIEVRITGENAADVARDLGMLVDFLRAEGADRAYPTPADDMEKQTGITDVMRGATTTETMQPAIAGLATVQSDAVKPTKRGRPKKSDAPSAPALAAGEDKSAQAPVGASDPKTEAPAVTPAVPQSDSTAATVASTDYAAAATPQSAPAASVPTFDDIRAAGMRFLEKNGETSAKYPRFADLLMTFGVRQLSALEESKRAAFVAACDA
jgi:hypothetical protein